MEQKKIKGGVIIIGSLRWENEKNAIQNKDSKELAKKREEWRNSYLNFKKEKAIPLPIGYGRSSSSRNCTYTMVFSNEYLDLRMGQGLLIPYKDDIDFSDVEIFKKHCCELAIIEGICKKDETTFRKKWGCIGIFINKKSDKKQVVSNFWGQFRILDNNYKKTPNDLSFENNSLIDNDYSFIESVVIDTDLDFLLFTYIQPQHRNAEFKRIPTANEIAEEIIRSGYKIYFEENTKHQIKTTHDEEIIKICNKDLMEKLIFVNSS